MNTPTYLQLLPADVVARELAPLLARCERPKREPPVLKQWARWTIYVLFIALASLLIVAIACLWWPREPNSKDSERLCEPFLCDWVVYASSPGYFVNVPPCGFCDGNSSNCYWAVIVDGYTQVVPWGWFPMGEYIPGNGIDICPPPIGPPGNPSLYYSSVPPALNGTTCYKPSDSACKGEEWIDDSSFGRYCQPLLDCTGRLAGSHYVNANGRVAFLATSISILCVVAVSLFAYMCLYKR